MAFTIFEVREMRNPVKNSNQYQNLTSEPSDIITELCGPSFAKQRSLCITIERHAIHIALSLHGTYIYA